MSPMTSAESRALLRASLLVLFLCVVRSVGGLRGREALPASEEDATSGLLAASSERRDEAARRSRPLGTDERLDPNTATEMDLDRLPGVGAVAARAIVELREEGGRFMKIEDLLAVPGIGRATLARMSPFLTLPESGRLPNRPARLGSRATAGGLESRSPIDLNRADRESLEGLPGVGPALASRILAVRDTLGRFRTLDQLQRVRGIGQATISRLKPLVFVGG